MKIVHIFGPAGDPEEGLWSLVEEGKRKNVLQDLFDNWLDPERMFACCRLQSDDLSTAFGYPISVREAANELMDEAEDLEQELIDLAEQVAPDAALQQLFRPLNNWETCLTQLQLSKASMLKNPYRNKPKLRVYAVRFGPHTYLVTGGAIKLTHRMEDRPHTNFQLQKLIHVRDWLKKEGSINPEDLTELA